MLWGPIGVMGSQCVYGVPLCYRIPWGLWGPVGVMGPTPTCTCRNVANHSRRSVCVSQHRYLRGGGRLWGQPVCRVGDGGRPYWGAPIWGRLGPMGFSAHHCCLSCFSFSWNTVKPQLQRGGDPISVPRPYNHPMALQSQPTALQSQPAAL